MKIVILDKASLGYDTPLSVLDKFGRVDAYDFSTPNEAILRSKDADVIIINKVKVTRELMESSDSLKLICIFATGYDNIDVNAARELGINVIWALSLPGKTAPGSAGRIICDTVLGILAETEAEV